MVKILGNYNKAKIRASSAFEVAAGQNSAKSWTELNTLMD